MSNDNLPDAPWVLGEYWPPQQNGPEADHLLKLANERLTGMVITHRRLTPAECLALWKPRD